MKFAVTTVCFCLLVALTAGCSFESDSAVPATPTRAATAVFTPIVLPTIVTVAPPPPPTLAPSPTSAATVAGATSVPQVALNTEMVDIPAGAFTMGSDSGGSDAKPPHPVTVAAFKMDKFEVTNADFKKFAAATNYKTDAEKSSETGWLGFANGRDLHPVVKVSWNDADAFCKWAGKRLPTEAEWEKAARGTDGRAFPWGNDYDPKKANVKDSGLRTTTVVGSFGAGASPFGVQDMAGNAQEWTASTPEVYPGGTPAGSKLYGPNLKIVRGGGWFDDKDHAAVYVRNSGVLTTANDDLGFRCAK